MKGMLKMSPKSVNSVHEPFDLGALQPTNTHIVEATISTCESTKTPPGKGSIVLEVGENTTYMALFNSSIALEVWITLANGDDCSSDRGSQVITGDYSGAQRNGGE